MFGKKRAKNGKKPGPPVHDDPVERDFTSAAAPNQLWLTDVTEHRTAEGKWCAFVINDVFSGWIVGYSIDSRMKSNLAVQALDNAVARRGNVAGCIVHSDRGSRVAISCTEICAHPEPARIGRLDEPGQCNGGQRRHGEVLRTAPAGRPQPTSLGGSGRAADRGDYLDRADIPQAPSVSPSRTVDP